MSENKWITLQKHILHVKINEECKKRIKQIKHIVEKKQCEKQKHLKHENKR